MSRREERAKNNNTYPLPPTSRGGRKQYGVVRRVDSRSVAVRSVASRSLPHGKRANWKEAREEETRRRRTKEEQKTYALFPRPALLSTQVLVPSRPAPPIVVLCGKEVTRMKKNEYLEEVSGKIQK